MKLKAPQRPQRTTYCQDGQHYRCRGFRGHYGRGKPQLVCECSCHARLLGAQEQRSA